MIITCRDGRPGANLAALRDADLCYANLCDADLRDADFDGARITYRGGTVVVQYRKE